LPNGIPTQPIPDLVPDFVIEVLRVGNTRAELSRKRREYFHAGVRLLWIVDPRDRTVAVFSSPETFTIANEEAVLDGADVLPGWQISLSDLFLRLDIGKRAKQAFIGDTASYCVLWSVLRRLVRCHDALIEVCCFGDQQSPI